MFYLLLLIITIPSFISLLNPWYYSMHDFQHVARLFLFDQALHQGQLYPRWVDLLGFNFGYPLFNFYPPLIYYVAEIFRLFGVSYIWSIKLMIVFGYIVGAFGMYLLGLRVTRSRIAGLVTATLYTFFTYHAVLVYVRGALAEFFSMSILPFVFLSLHMLRDKITISRALFFGITFGLLNLAHPLIAFPSVIFIGLVVGHLLLVENKERLRFLLHAIIGGVVGLGLSAFFWLPSLLERKFTLVDTILTRELASYKIHFVQPIQLWFSSFGYGGSGEDFADGMSFQLGKIHIAMIALSIIGYILISKNKNLKREKRDYRGYLILCTFAVFMCLPFSQIVWDNVKFLWYLQFPWRFLTFAGIFIAILGGFGVSFLTQYLESMRQQKWLVGLVTSLIVLGTVWQYHKYFQPSGYVKQSNAQLTSFDEIAWKVSSSSFEFSPKGVPLKQSQYNTSVFDIEKNRISTEPFQKNPNLQVKQLKNLFHEKEFEVNATQPTRLQLNTFNFPGWSAYINNEKATINDDIKYKLITVAVPKGEYSVRVVFEDTGVRRAANAISTGTIALCFLLLYLESVRRKKKNLA